MLVRRLRLDGVRLAKTTTTHELVEQAGPLLVEHVIGSRVKLEHARGAHQPLVEPVEQTEPVEEASRRRERGVAGPLGARRADAVEAQGRKVGAKGGGLKKASRTGSGRARRSKTSARTAQRAESRRPIDDGEVERLEALGSRLADLRRSAGLSQVRLATRAELAPSTIERLEAGTRRTRRSTLGRIARALELPDAAGELVDLAGPAWTRFSVTSGSSAINSRMRLARSSS